MWNCGDVSPVMVLMTNETDWAWRGEVPMYIPNVALGDHFGIELLFCNVVLREKMGHPNVW